MKRAAEARRAKAKDEKSAQKKHRAAAAGSPLNPDLFQPETVAELKAKYKASSPFPHVVVPALCDPTRAKALEVEARSGLKADFKETDLFKVYQTPDLGNLGLGEGTDAAGDASLTTTTAAAAHWQVPHLVSLRDALYSEEFRNWVADLAGCGPLEPKADCSCNAYVEGGHLLCHDDVISTRRVSYIIYLNDPEQPWTSEDGGALELYPLSSGGVGHPDTTPCRNILPAFNQMVLFTVVPGVSFHAVQEVFAKGKPRLSISGWFHGKEPPPGMEHATRMQLAGSNADPMSSIAPWVPTAANLASDKGASEKANKDDENDDDDDEDEENLDPVKLSDEDIATLKPWLNPDYLESAVLTQLRKRFADPEQGSAVQLDEFLQPKVAQALRDATRAADTWDKPNTASSSTAAKKKTEASSEAGASAAAARAEESGADASTFIPYASGVGDGWQACGPVHKQRFLRFDAASQEEENSASTSAAAPAAAAATSAAADSNSASKRAAGVLLEEVRINVFGSPAFQRWLFEVTRLRTMQYRSLTRRFRPGLDYTVAHTGGMAAKGSLLDTTLCFLDDQQDLGPEVVEKDKRGRSEAWHLWDSGEVGGFECYVEAEGFDDDDNNGEGQDAAVYEQRVIASEARDTGEGSSNGGGGGGGNEGNGDDDDESDSEGSEAGGTLLSVQGRCNCLSVVLRDEGVMRFVKFVSASAPSSRWDVAAEFQVE